MKIIKPLKLALLNRTFEAANKWLMSISTMAFVPFEGPSLLHTEQDMWNTLASEMGKDLILDQGIPKPRGEVLVSGKFFSPSRQPVPAHKVRLQGGGIDKTLYVFGDRFWQRTKAGTWTITDPSPITELEITYSNAFGGPKFNKNPLGKGIEPVSLPSGKTAVPLPNIELPDQLIVSKGDRPDPAGFGPLDITWPQRAKKAGTYDKKWLKERFPGFAEDMDWTIFNMAPEDQQIDGFFEGTESFVFENMHPERPSLSAKLPGLRVRCFVNQELDGETVFKELPTRLDTVWVFPHLEKVLLIYRGTVEVRDEEVQDISHLLLACEGPKDTPRSVEHYKQALEKRLDEETGHLNMLNESDLLPEGEPSGLGEIMASTPKEEDLINQNMERRLEREKQKAFQALEAQGLDPKEIIKEQPPAPQITMDNLAEIPNIVAELEQQAEKQQREMKERAERMLQELGLDPEEVKKKALEGQRRWPKFSAQENIQRLREFGIQDPETEEKLRQAEEQISSSLRQVAHYLPPSHEPSQEESSKMKELLELAKQGRESVVDTDLAFLDLSGMDLRGIDLSRAYLEGVVLNGTNLEDANLSGAILVRAKIHKSNLKGANLQGANLGHAQISDSDLQGVKGKEIVLAEAKVSNTDFSGSELSNADLTKARIENCDLSKTILKDVMFMEASLRNCKFFGADLTDTIFLNADLQGSDFSEASLGSSTLVKANGRETKFQKARMQKACFADKCEFAGVDFVGADLTEANLRGTELSGAHFDQADLSRADLSQCNLKEASFLLAIAKGTQFVKADLTGARMIGINLMEGSLQKAQLVQTDLSGANLYGVDFIRAEIFNTRFQGANLKRAFLERWIQSKK